MKLLWTTLQVNDLENSLSFYRDLLGMPVAERFSNQEGAEIVMLGETDGAFLELITKGAPAEPGRGVSIGLPFADIEEIGEKLASAGYRVTPVISPNPKVRFRFVSDPDGYQVQLVER